MSPWRPTSGFWPTRLQHARRFFEFGPQASRYQRKKLTQDNTRQAIHTLHGHTSTVRCLKMSDSNTAISGSRDTTLRIWDIQKGICKHVLVGHQASVRCLEIHGDIIVSGSYDTQARIWSISEGRCLRTLTGHFSQIYAIAFDGRRIATGSLDTSVRIWNPSDG